MHNGQTSSVVGAAILPLIAPAGDYEAPRRQAYRQISL